MGSDEQDLLNEVSGRDTSLLDDDSIPNENQSLTCFSCEEPMTGLYCYACGNKNDNYRRSVWSLGVELFQSLTAFEGRIWKSLYSLIFKPGQMARDYADGARQRWTSPIRMFLATSLLLFGYIALSGTQIIALGDLEPGKDRSDTGIQVNVDEQDYNQGLLFFVRKSQLKKPPETRVAALRQDFAANFLENRTPESLQDGIEALTIQIDESPIGIGREVLIEMRRELQDDLERLQGGAPTSESDDGATGKEAANDSTLRFRGLSGETIALNSQGMSELYARILENPAIINNQLNTKLKWAMFFMMPFAMFLGAMFIRGRETAMLYDHLVHAAYVHSFSFLLLFIFILLAQFTPLSGLIGWYTLILLIYLPISVRRAFKRGRFKSFLTAYGVGSVYTLMIFFVSLFIVALALQSVAIDISSYIPSSTIPRTAP